MSDPAIMPTFTIIGEDFHGEQLWMVECDRCGSLLRFGPIGDVDEWVRAHICPFRHGGRRGDRGAWEPGTDPAEQCMCSHPRSEHRLTCPCGCNAFHARPDNGSTGSDGGAA